MNEVEPGAPLDITEFYDALAPEYDTMTGFQNRFVQEKPFFRLLVQKYDIRKALDAGCGTGFHSLLLAQLGVQMTAVDISPAMIVEARRHSQQMSIPIKAVERSLANLRGLADSPFDAVFSLGNTIAHILSNDELQLICGNFFGILRPQGILLLQLLNYDRILAGKERVQSVKEIDGKTFVRFYDYNNDSLSFNILTIDRTGGGARQSMKTVQLKPLGSADLISRLASTGFSDIRLYGGISMDDYIPQTSKDLVVLARRPQSE
ncbi:MAG TPA: class I SAM-dependent methyltransferase [Bacteroidota bacterium]